MGFNWEEVDRLVKPSPNYQTLIGRLQEVFSYEFVNKHYCHSMKEAEKYATRLLGGDPRQRYGEYLKSLSGTFEKLDKLGFNNYREFIDMIGTKEKLEDFFNKAELTIDEIIRVLKYLLNWVLPSRKYLRELIDKENPTALQYVTSLREGGIRFTLDILEKGSTVQGRRDISKATGVPEDFIHEIANRADFTRMPYVSGSTVRHFFYAGYDSIEKLAHVDLTTLTNDMDRYFSEIGMKWKHAVELDSSSAIARVLPKIIEL